MSNRSNRGHKQFLVDNYQEIVDNIDEKIELEERRVEAYRQRLVEKFANLEAVLSELNDQYEYLVSQLENLGSISSD